jgi:hypothetical protein
MTRVPCCTLIEFSNMSADMSPTATMSVRRHVSGSSSFVVSGHTTDPLFGYCNMNLPSAWPFLVILFFSSDFLLLLCRYSGL